MKRKFSIAQILSLTTSRHYCENFNETVDILEFLTNCKGLMTHHLPTANKYIQNDLEKIIPEELLKRNWVHDGNWKLRIKKLQEKLGDIELSPIVEKNDISFSQYIINNSLLKTIGTKK